MDKESCHKGHVENKKTVLNYPFHLFCYSFFLFFFCFEIYNTSTAVFGIIFIYIHIRYKNNYGIYFFFSSLSISRITGAAGIPNHHSRSLLIHLSVLAFLGGEYLVNISKNVNRTKYLPGMKARITAVITRAMANFSLA